MFKKWKWTRIVMALILALSLAGGGLTLAGKGGKGKGGGGGGGEPQPPADPAIACNSRSNLMVMNADGSNQTVILEGFALPSWSPDGTSIAVSGANTIWIVDIQVIEGEPQATDVRLLVPDVRVLGLAWSPDGRWIAYADDTLGDGLGAMTSVVPAVGGDPIPVIDLDRTDAKYPTWSPDGTLLAYQMVGPFNNFNSEIWVKDLDVDGDGLADLLAVDPFDPGTPILSQSDTGISLMKGLDWSRTGSVLDETGTVITDNMIAFHGYLSGNFHIFTVHFDLALDPVDGSLVATNVNWQQLATPNGSASPSWAPDDTAIVFSAPEGKHSTSIWKLDFVDGTLTVLAGGKFVHLGAPDWRRF